MLRPARTIPTLLARTMALFALACVLCSPAFAQTAADTIISNQASATYSDGTNSYSTVSNTVTVIVSKVAGLAITPDAGANPSVVAGQTLVIYNFTVTNTGNFSDQVHFVPGSAHLGGTAPATITRTFIDVDNSGTINAGDTDITGATADSAFIAQNGFIHVLVEVSVGGAATAGQTVQVILGDAATGGPSFDNQPVALPNGGEVRTVSAASVNGQREAKGDITASVVDDALLLATLTAPAGPIALGGDINYSVVLQNTGTRPASGVSLTGGAGPFVYVIVPIPLNTTVKAGQVFPAGTLFTTDPLVTAPLAANYVSAQPPVANIRRIAFQVGANLGAGATSSSFPFIVTVNLAINASNPIWEITDAFAKTSLGSNITEQSGDAIVNKGDGNANFDEPRLGVDAATPTQGFQQRTLLQALGSVLLGPSGAPAAVGPTDNNDDYTNKSSNPANIAPGGLTTALGVLIYTNTLQNTGNANDTYTLDAPVVPAGFLVEISTNGGALYTDVSSGGSTSLAVGFGASANILVRVTIPVGKLVLTAFSTTVRATSTVTPASNNKTIDRSYTGFIQLVKAFTVTNGTGVGGATDPVPGAVINYNITYTNISSSNGDANCVKLTASNLVITEDGNVAPNNWGGLTTHVAPAADSGSGVVVVVSATKYTDTVASVAPGASGIFTFKRSIN